jgi:hypothetical protein
LRRALFALVALLCAPPCAQAARLTEDATTGVDGGPFYVYRADAGERNQVTVRFTGSRLTIVDRGARRIAVGDSRFSECRATGPRRVVCGNFPIDIYLGDRNDTVDFVPGDDTPDRDHRDPFYLARDELLDSEFIPYADFVNAGRGDDRVTGSSRIDYVQPGPGRDRVDTRGGDDTLYLRRDGARDRIRTGGGTDEANFAARHKPVHVDLTKGMAGGDRLSGVERVIGTPAGDTLVGSAQADALYGDGGRDRIEGGAGNDLLVGEMHGEPSSAENELVGGAGDDVIDARWAPARVDCRDGADTVAGDTDDLLDPNCELVGLRGGSEYYEDHPRLGRMKAWPVRTDADGTPTFEVPCPPATGTPRPHCKGEVRLERPPDGGEDYGSGSFDFPAKHRSEVTVTLTPAGRAAIAAREPVAVHVTGAFGEGKIDFGWQLVLPPPG